MTASLSRRNTLTLSPRLLLTRLTRLFIIGFVTLLCLSTLAQAAQVTLAWDANTEPDLAGYKIYYGTAPGNFSTSLAVGNVTTYTVTNLTAGVTYYFTLTALNSMALESGYSNEISYTPPTITQYTLTVSNTGTGAGTVTNTPTGTTFNTGTVVSLTAAPDASSNFTGWSGACSGTANPCSVTLNANTTITANFNLKTWILTASAGANGTISPSGAVTVNQGTSRTFTITPNTGYRIANVTVDGVSVGAVGTYTFSAVTANHTIAATFTANTYTLTVTKVGTGTGTVTNTPAGTLFSTGTVVSLTAAPDTASTFAGWSGACSGTANPCTVTVTGNTTVTATFNLETVKPSSVISSPTAGITLHQSSFTITGTAADGSGSGLQKVEVSTDGGSTWMLAVGTSTWTHSWSIPGNGSYQIKSRATDFAGNVETPTAGVSVQVAAYQPTPVTVTGKLLLVNGAPFQVKGVVYSPVPIGEDPNMTSPYGDYFTGTYGPLHDRDLPLLRTMGANTLRLYHWEKAADHFAFLDRAYNGGVDPIYIIAGFWIDAGLNLDPNSPANVREHLKSDFREMVAAHKSHPAILMWSLGHNLNQAGLSSSQLSQVFSLINEMAVAAQQEEGTSAHPVTTALADQDLAATLAGFESTVPALDIWGANVYRGKSFGTLFSDLGPLTPKPLLIMEYGIDAFDQTRGDEYEKLGTPVQADYAEALWKEIAANGQTCLGGTIMSYSDEWWKARYAADPGCIPDPDPAVQGRCGLATAAQPDGYANEDWWGLVRVRDNGTGTDTVEPRAAYYRLQALWKNSPLLVSSPNGGESLRIGSAQTIRWTYTGQPGTTVKIQVLKNGSVAQTITKSTAIGANGQGSYTWTPSYRLKPGSGYQIRITSNGNSAYGNTSNGNFSLTN